MVRFSEVYRRALVTILSSILILSVTGVFLQVPEIIVFLVLWDLPSCFVFCLLFLLFYVISAPVLAEAENREFSLT